MPRRSTVYVQMPHTWLGRLAALVVSVAVVVLAFFFFTVVLAAAGVALLVHIIRLLWSGRRIRRSAPRDIIEGEYRVEPEERLPADSGPDPTRKKN